MLIELTVKNFQRDTEEKHIFTIYRGKITYSSIPYISMYTRKMPPLDGVRYGGNVLESHYYKIFNETTGKLLAEFAFSILGRGGVRWIKYPYEKEQKYYRAIYYNYNCVKH